VSSECGNKSLNMSRQLLLAGALSWMFASPATGIEAEKLVAISVVDTVSVLVRKTANLSVDLPAMVTLVDVNESAVAGSARIKDVLPDVPGVAFSGSLEPGRNYRVQVNYQW